MDRVKELLQDKAAHDKLCKIFPKAVREVDFSAFGFDGLKGHGFDPGLMLEELATNVPSLDGVYGFTWTGKKKVWLLSNMKSTKTLRLVREKSVGRDGTPGSIDSENIYIEGDSLEALSILRETYAGKIKMIYIDPPYNTGNDFIYADNFKASYDDYRKMFEEENERC